MKRIIHKIAWAFDCFIYRLFYWRWNKRLSANAHLCLTFKYFIDAHLTKGPDEIERLNNHFKNTLKKDPTL